MYGVYMDGSTRVDCITFISDIHLSTNVYQQLILFVERGWIGSIGYCLLHFTQFVWVYWGMDCLLCCLCQEHMEILGYTSWWRMMTAFYCHGFVRFLRQIGGCVRIRNPTLSYGLYLTWYPSYRVYVYMYGLRFGRCARYAVRIDLHCYVCMCCCCLFIFLLWRTVLGFLT